MIKKVLGLVFASLMCLANSGYVGASAAAEENFYCDTQFYAENMNYLESGSGSTTTIEDIYCDSYTMTQDILTDRDCPTYANMTQLNSCAPMAATIALGYYDVEYTNLIPDYEPGSLYNGVYYYLPQNSTISALKYNLYDLMGTNSVHPGTSLSQFKSGLKSYVNGQGYNISYVSCGNSLNINTAISYFQQQKIVVLFANSYKYYDIGGIAESEGKISKVCKSNTNGHVLVAFGYREFQYYKNGSVFQTDKFMVVSFGDGSVGYLSVNDLSTIDNSYMLNIY